MVKTDKRNWKSYNEELVMRGEFLLPIGNWDEELDKMNEGKKGGLASFLKLRCRLYGSNVLVT